ncbi:MAG: glycosyltransferase family 4 protein [bacterium]
MKLIYLANARIPAEKAHGIQIMKTCEAFVREGVEVELVLPFRFNQKFKNIDPFSYYNLKTKFKITKLFSLDLVPLSRWFSPWGFWLQAFSFAIVSNFYLFFKRGNLIYSRDEFSLYFLSFWQKNFVYEMHAFPESNFYFYNRIFKKAKKIIVITHQLKDLLIKQGIESEKTLVAPDGVDLEQFNISESQESCRQKLNLPQDKKIVLYAGHLYKWKGVAVLLEAARKSEIPALPSGRRDQKPEILFVFVGGTKEDIESFKLKVISYKLTNVLVVDHRPYSEIPYWLKAADVLILPNSAREKISQFYTSPLKLFEYMASGRPIVASNLPSIREVLSENNAILVKSDDPISLSGGIASVLQNSDFSAKIAKQALQDVEAYSWKKRAKNILSFIK